MGEDEELSSHFDNAEVTLNVNLGVAFEQGELVFYGHKLSATATPTAYHDWQDEGRAIGHGVLHLGSQVHAALPPPESGSYSSNDGTLIWQVHAALPIQSGERRNLVMWMRSRAQRQISGCPMCGKVDRLLPASADDSSAS